MPTLTPVDFDPFYEATGADKPEAKAELLSSKLFNTVLKAVPIVGPVLGNENFQKGFVEGIKKSGTQGVRSINEALNNQYIPDNAAFINDAGEFLDKDQNVLKTQRRPNLIPLTKKEDGGFELAMPAMADVWNTVGNPFKSAGKGITLGAGPSLRPALKYQDKIYKAKEGQQHLDALPAHLQDEFQRMALSGEDITHFNFGFMNHKGQFLQREDALKYAIDNGLLDPQDAKYGTLVTTMLNKSGGEGKLASQAAASMRNKDLNIEKSFGVNNEPIYIVKNKNGEEIAEARMSHTGEYVVDLGVKPEFRRQGIATDLYNHIEKDLGKKLKPSPVYQTEAGDAFWKNRNKPAPTFYSAVENAVDSIKQNKASGDQWLSTLSNQKGVKGEELEWNGLKEFLAGKQSVTKQEVQDYLKNNKVELGEVWKGVKADETSTAFNKKVEEILAEAKSKNEPMMRSRAEDMAYEQMGFNPTKYSQWQLPGGENYRELLMTLPGKSGDNFDPSKVSYKKLNDYTDGTTSYRLSYGDKEIGTFSDYKNEPRSHDEWVDVIRRRFGGDPILGIKPLDTSNYRSSHWDEPNILAHMRMNDRTIDGKKSLHLEEIQSDWHQQGREKGYRPQLEKEFNALVKERDEMQANWDKIKDNPDSIDRLNDIHDKIRDMGGNDPGVPDAPFKKTWHELALKRAIREAAENGYERLSWTPGEAQAARYDLSKQVDKVNLISHETAMNGKKMNFRVEAFKDNKRMVEQYVADENELASVVGKEIAKKLLDTRNQHGASTLAERDLKIGGEGMKGFYDNIIPKSVEKIAKEFGVKVRKGETISDKEGWHITPPTETTSKKWMVKSSDYNSKGMHFDTKAEAEKALAEKLKKAPIFYIDIPDNMRQSIVGKGQPLFSGTPILTPVDFTPEFEENK